MTVDFTDITHFSIPVFLIEGQHDEHVSSTIAIAWYHKIASEKTLHVFDKSAHFPQWEQPDTFHQVVKDLLKQTDF